MLQYCEMCYLNTAELLYYIGYLNIIELVLSEHQAILQSLFRKGLHKSGNKTGTQLLMTYYRTGNN